LKYINPQRKGWRGKLSPRRKCRINTTCSPGPGVEMIFPLVGARHFTFLGMYPKLCRSLILAAVTLEAIHLPLAPLPTIVREWKLR
jgi:hypothetical protein